MAPVVELATLPSPGTHLIALTGGARVNDHRDFSLAQHVTDMIILLDRLGIDAIHVCGM
jgi:hypothetical protein